MRLTYPRCGLTGHKDVGTGRLFDIQLHVEDEYVKPYTPRPRECPFEDAHGLTVEVGNNA